MNPSEARAHVEAEKECGHDGGYCNPRKAKEYAEALERAKRK